MVTTSSSSWPHRPLSKTTSSITVTWSTRWEAKLGGMVPHVRRSVFNPRTQKYFGFSDEAGSQMSSITGLTCASTPDGWADPIAGRTIFACLHPHAGGGR